MRRLLWLSPLALLACACAGPEADVPAESEGTGDDVVIATADGVGSPEVAPPIDDAPMPEELHEVPPDVSLPLPDLLDTDLPDTAVTTEVADPEEVEPLPDVETPGTEPALVWLDPPGATGPTGSVIDLSWSSLGATACAARLDGVVAGEGTSGTVAVTVQGVRRVVVSCEPAGGGSIAAATIAPACSGQTTIERLSAFGGNPTDGAGNPVPLDGTCIVVNGDALTAALDPAFAARITTVTGSLSLFHGGDNGLDFVALTIVMWDASLKKSSFFFSRSILDWSRS